MDPQSRFLLEQTGAALADAAGSAAGAAPPNTGVYVGVMHIEFIHYLTSAAPGGDAGSCVSSSASKLAHIGRIYSSA